MTKILIKDGVVIDGSGKKGCKADVLIENNEIVDVGTFEGVDPDHVIDAMGKVVSPGFIDMHSHADLSLPFAPHAESLIHQGITTVVTGQCGISTSPVSKKGKQEFIKSLGMESSSHFWDDVESFGDFLDRLETTGTAVNVEPLVGHGNIRAAVMGYSSEKASSEQIKKMQRLVEESLEQGAIGLSTGLIYPPGYYSDTQELIECTKPVAEKDGFYFSHVRGESETLLSSIKE